MINREEYRKTLIFAVRRINKSIRILKWQIGEDTGMFRLLDWLASLLNRLKR